MPGRLDTEFDTEPVAGRSSLVQPDPAKVHAGRAAAALYHSSAEHDEGESRTGPENTGRCAANYFRYPA